MSPLTPKQIHQEMVKIGARRAGSPVPVNDCSDAGHCNGGDQFILQTPDADYDNTIHFKSQSNGHEFSYPAKDTGTYEMNFEVANDTFDCWFSSSDDAAEFLVIVNPGGKGIRVEDQGHWGDEDYTDLLIDCVEGSFSMDGDDTGSLTYVSGGASDSDCPEGCPCSEGLCGGPDGEVEEGCETDEDCPDGQVCKDGVCVNACETDEDCPEGEVCEDGVCTGGGGEGGGGGGGGGDGGGDYDEHGCLKDDSEIWNGEKCICANEYIWNYELDKCVPQCDPTPPVKGDGDCGDESPCHGVTCMPPRECDEESGECICPKGTVDSGNGLCIPDELCLNVLCPPNATCDPGSGHCICDEGYVLNDRGYCVMAETADCKEEPDCCPSNSTIQIKAGSGLGGGGSFRLNQPCDKTIMLWVDNSTDIADEDCDEYGQAQVCSCTAEIAQLMDLIVELQAEMGIIKDAAEICAENNECIGTPPNNGGGNGGGGGGGGDGGDGGDGGSGAFQCGDTPENCAPINVQSRMNDEPRFYTHDWGGAPEIVSMEVINQDDEQNHRIIVEFASCLPSISENSCITGDLTAAGAQQLADEEPDDDYGDILEVLSIDVTQLNDTTYEFFFYGTIQQAPGTQGSEDGINDKSFVPADWTFYCCEETPECIPSFSFEGQIRISAPYNGDWSQFMRDHAFGFREWENCNGLTDTASTTFTAVPGTYRVTTAADNQAEGSTLKVNGVDVPMGHFHEGKHIVSEVTLKAENTMDIVIVNGYEDVEQGGETWESNPMGMAIVFESDDCG